MAGLHETTIRALETPTGPLDAAVREKVARRREDHARRRDEAEPDSAARGFRQGAVDGGDAALTILDGVAPGAPRARARTMVARLLRAARAADRKAGPTADADLALWNHAQSAYRVLIDREADAEGGGTLVDAMERENGAGAVAAWDGSGEPALVGAPRA